MRFYRTFCIALYWYTTCLFVLNTHLKIRALTYHALSACRPQQKALLRALHSLRLNPLQPESVQPQLASQEEQLCTTTRRVCPNPLPSEPSPPQLADQEALRGRGQQRPVQRFQSVRSTNAPERQIGAKSRTAGRFCSGWGNGMDG